MKLGLLLVGDVDKLDKLDVYKGLAALMAAWEEGLRINAVIGREQPIDSLGVNLRFDSVLYKLKIPIDIKGLVGREIPRAVVEDSTDLKRLWQRHREVKGLLLNHGIGDYYVHVCPLLSGKVALKLEEVRQDDFKFYKLEVRV
jgi:hypothetical protein